MITFHSHNREDISLRVKWLNNHLVVQYTLDDPKHITDKEEQIEWFDNYEKEFSNNRKKFFTILSTNKPVGFMGLSNINQIDKTAEVFILIGEDDYRGKGIGKIAMKYLIDFAFSQLKLKELKLEVNKNNLPAINLYHHFGFGDIKKTENEFLMSLSV